MILIFSNKSVLQCRDILEVQKSHSCLSNSSFRRCRVDLQQLCAKYSLTWNYPATQVVRYSIWTRDSPVTNPARYHWATTPNIDWHNIYWCHDDKPLSKCLTGAGVSWSLIRTIVSSVLVVTHHISKFFPLHTFNQASILPDIFSMLATAFLL